MGGKSIKEICIETGKLPGNYNQINFCTFDIESLGIPFDDHSNGNTKIHSLQRVISIAVTASFRPSHSATEVFMRTEMTKQGHAKLITDLMIHLHKLQQELTDSIPNEITSAIQFMKDEIALFRKKERNYSIHQVNTIQYTPSLKFNLVSIEF